MAPQPDAPDDLQPPDVGERLRRLQRLGVHRGRSGLAPVQPAARRDAPRFTSAQDDSAATESPLRDAHPSSLHAAAPSLEDRIGAVETITRLGSCLVCETRLPLVDARGVSLAATASISGPAVAACSRDGALSDFDFHRAAFLDTETSGLAGGAGTFAFMVGIGRYEESGGELLYVVRQVFMRSPAEERALLEATADLLADCAGVVSFNGRAFDLPLLAMRYGLKGRSSPLAGLQHFDLLPAARQRWRLRLPSCALGALERDILAYTRAEEDVPGYLIPSMYADYARGVASGSPSPAAIDDIARVFYHNREDIVSMVPLAAMLCAPFEENGQAALREPQHPIDMVSLARSFEDLGWFGVCERVYRTALDRPLPSEARAVALSRLGWLLKRQERRAEAASVWQDWITSVSGPDPTPYEELAKHHEWHTNDLVAARTWTLWALHTARQLTPGAGRDQALTALQHRLDRLDRKLAEAPP